MYRRLRPTRKYIFLIILFQQEKSNLFLMFSHGGKKWLIRWFIEKISSVQSVKFGSFCLYRIHTEVNSQIVVSGFATYKIPRFLSFGEWLAYKLSL